KKVRYKWVKEVEFINEIPKSPSGKILRRVLRDKEKAGKFGMVVNDEARAKLRRLPDRGDCDVRRALDSAYFFC
ncbi:MAG: hypothetical protein EOP04_15835, partial [Proteobacteria bacterium]